MDSAQIPIVDFSGFSLDKKEEDIDGADLKRLADEIYVAFSTIGFVYLKNFGISPEKVSFQLHKYTFINICVKYLNIKMLKQ